MTPLLGLAFLISAMTAGWPAAIFARSASTNPRTRDAPSRRAGKISVAHARAALVDLDALARKDALQDVGHGFSEVRGEG